MYRKLLEFEPDGGLILAAKFGLALVDAERDCIAEGTQMNAILRAACTKSELQTESVALDAYQTVFHTLKPDLEGERRERFEQICKIILDGIPFYRLSFLKDLQKQFITFHEDFYNLDAADTIHEMAAEAGKGTVLAYLIDREILNILMRSSAFLDRQSLVRVLTEELSNYSEDAREEAVKLSGDIFFYGSGTKDGGIRN